MQQQRAKLRRGEGFAKSASFVAERSQAGDVRDSLIRFRL
jgi:hypothetical protein